MVMLKCRMPPLHLLVSLETARKGIGSGSGSLELPNLTLPGMAAAKLTRGTKKTYPKKAAMRAVENSDGGVESDAMGAQ